MNISNEIDTISEVFEVPYDYLWDYITNPLMFPVLYPNWVTIVNMTRKNEFSALGPSGEKFIIIPDLNKEYGVIDFKTVDKKGDKKTYRSRLVAIDSCKTVLVRLIYHLNGIDDPDFNWETYKSTIHKDYKNARKIVENVFHNNTP